jgi:hypothetical protein
MSIVWRWQGLVGLWLCCAIVGEVVAQEGSTEIAGRTAVGGVKLAATPSAGESVVRVRTEAEAAEVAERRVVKVFDFDERRLGNLEPIPMHWFRRREQGYPLYSEGEFDRAEGHPAPSFWLGARGGDVAFDYRGRDVPVKANSDYRITARIRAQDLHHAGAGLTAHFMNRAGERITGSEARSDFVGGSSPDWQQVTVGLPGTFPEARYIGLTATIEQSPSMPIGEKRPGQIELRDVRGGAWFDDIEVIRLPRILLTTDAPGNVFGPDQAASILAEAGDSDGIGLQADLEIHSASGELVHVSELNIQKQKRSPAVRVALPDLGPGLYHASLTMTTGDRELVRREMDFGKLAPTVRGGGGHAAGFGVILESDERGQWEAVARLLREALADHVKLPIWRTGLTKQQIVVADELLDPLVQALSREKVLMTGVFSDPPVSLLDPGESAGRSLIDLLSEDADAWSPFVRMTLSRYATLIPQWQLGGDGEEDLLWDARLTGTLESLRKSMAELVYGPRLVVPWSASHTTEGVGLGADHLSLTIPETMPPGSIRDQLSTFLSGSQKETWAVVESLPVGTYPRLPRLADFAKRLIFAHSSGVDQVFIRQPWRSVPNVPAHWPQPTEDYLVFRTVADMLHRTMPAGEIHLGGRARCLIFDHLGRSVLAAWDDGGANRPVEHGISLGAGLGQIDLWGVRRPVSTVGDQMTVELGPVPVFLMGAPTWLAKTIGSFQLDPNHIDAQIKTHPVSFSFSNHHVDPISGELRLDPPAGWHMEPRLMRFSLKPGQTFERGLGVRFPYSQTAGPQRVPARVTLYADRRYDLEVPLTVEVSLTGIHVQTLVNVQGDQVIVQQTVSNLSENVVTFHGTCMVPGVPEAGNQRLIIPELAPGRSATRLYRIRNASDLAGKTIRVGLRDRGLKRVYNEELLIP